MKLSQSICFAALLITLGASSTSFAAILLNDNFADASRTETNLPTESHFFVSHPDASTVLANTLRYQIQSASTKAHVYFATGSQYSKLGVGDTLSASVTFQPRVAINQTSTSRNFRLGLFYDPTDGNVLADTNDDGGGNPNDPWQDAEGYGMFANIRGSANTTAHFTLGKRTGLATTNLLGTTGAYTSANGGAPVVMAVNSEYTYTMDITKTSETVTNVTMSLFQTGVGLLSTHSVSDNGLAAPGGLGTTAPYDRFNFIGFRWSDADSTASIFDIKTVVVNGPGLVPEPASLALFGASALALVLRRRR